jgi:putative intracellular protease/amidase
MVISSGAQQLRTMSKTALVLATDGTEDIELIATVDVLRRANVNVSYSIYWKLDLRVQLNI